MIRIRSTHPILTILLAGACSLCLHAQSPDAPPVSTLAPSSAAQDPSAAKARDVLNAMVQALGGQRWLDLQNGYTYGRIAAFYQGKPTGETVLYWSWHTPAVDRVDLSSGKKDNQHWTQVFADKGCWEFTFRGRNPLPKDQCDEINRRHEHSIENAVRVWMKQPGTILMYEGQSLAERHLAQQVTLLNADNDSITIQVDAQTHLPLSRTYYWRDPVYHDKNTDLEEYDDYHVIDGLPTPFAISRVRNGDMVQQRFVLKAAYNVPLPTGAFSDRQPARIPH